MLDENGPFLRDSDTGPQRNPASFTLYRPGKRLSTQFFRSGFRQLLEVGSLGVMTLLFCQCRQPSSSTPTPTPSSTVTPTPTATPSPTATVVPTPTPTPTASTP